MSVGMIGSALAYIIIIIIIITTIIISNVKRTDSFDSLTLTVPIGNRTY